MSSPVDEESDDEGVGAQAPPLTEEIASILRRYPDGGQILKELIQNADDAGATEVRFLTDSRDGHSKDTMFKNFSQYQGPALYAWNNAVFKRDDWQALAKIDRSSKKKDVLKVGRFGLGFMSVFHLTDLPLVVSGKHVAFIDPHRTSVEVPDTCPAGIKKRMTEVFQHNGHASTFDGVFGCSASSSEYDATLFRFPLRQHASQSKISANVNSVEDIKSTHFESLKCEASFLLLFLNSVNKISLYDMNPSTGKPELLFSVETAPQRLKAQPQQNCTIHLNCTTTTVTRDKNDCQDFHWLVLNVVGCADDEISTLSQELCTVPWVGVAAQLPVPVVVNGIACTSDDVFNSLPELLGQIQQCHKPIHLAQVGESLDTTSGYAFCFLPLPVRTFLPVHLHAYFAVSDNRRSIKWPEHDDKSADARWNELLVSKLIAPAYSLLLSTKCALFTYDVNLSSIGSDHFKRVLREIYSLWPSYSEIKNSAMCLKLLNSMSTFLRDSEILWTLAEGGRWVSFHDAYYTSAGCPTVALKTLLEVGLPVVLFPDAVTKMINNVDILSQAVESHKVSPDTLRKKFPQKRSTKLSCDDAKSLLEYMLSDNISDYSQLVGISLLPLQNGSFCKFAFNGTSDVKYVLSDSLKKYYPDILPGVTDSIVDTCLPVSLQRHMEAIASSGTTQIKLVSPDNCKDLFKASLLKWCTLDGKSFKWCPGRAGHPDSKWLQRVWEWIHSETLQYERILVDLPLLPKKYFNVQELSLFPIGRSFKFCRLPEVKNEHDWCSLLESLHIVAVADDITGKISSLPLLTCGLLLDQLMTMPNVINVVKGLSVKKRQLLRSFFCNQTYSNPRHIKCLRTLPMFDATSTASRLLALDHTPRTFLPPNDVTWPQELKSPEGMLCNRNPEVTALIMGLKTLPLSMAEFCTNHVLPLVLKLISVRNTRSNGDSILLWVLHQINHLPEKNKDFQQIVKFIKDMPLFQTQDSTYCRVVDLYDRQEPAFRILFNCLSDKIPNDVYLPYQHLLKIMGLQSWSIIKSDQTKLLNILMKSMNSISDPTLSMESIKERGNFILDVIFANSDLSINKKLSSMKFLLASKRPSTFPTSLKWFTDNYPSSKFFSIDSLFLYHNAKIPSLVGSIHPIISQDYQLKNPRAGMFKVLSKDDVLCQLKYVESLSKPEDELNEVIVNIYEQLKNMGTVRLLEKVWSPFLNPPQFIESSRFVSWAPFDLKPFFHQLHYPQFESIWTIKPSIEVKDALTILQSLCDRQRKILSENELDLSKNLINWLFEQKASPTCDVLILTTEHFLDVPQNCVFDDREWYKNRSVAYSTSYKYVDSDRISAAVAKYFNVRPLSLVIAPSSNLRIEYTRSGQYESITNRIARIVEDYKNDIDIFKELIQNADDAEATEIKFLIDWRRHPDSSLFCEKMKAWQGPALLAYNNAKFTREDLANICKVAGETKMSDPMKTGKFGLGFCAMYHMTDVPSFVTGKYLVIFDPHTSYLGERVIKTAPGMEIDLVETRKELKCYSHQLLPYNNVFGCDIFNLGGNGYDGTLFRFPFRDINTSCCSEISHKIYGKEEVSDLVDSLKKNSQELILFLKHISTITLFEVNENSADIVQLFSVNREFSHLEQRLKILKNGCAQNVENSCSAMCTIKISQGERMVRESSWIVCSRITSKQQFPGDKVRGVLPFGEIALELSVKGASKFPSKDVSGRIFCFLPLPIANGLSFHVNSHFHISKDRRNLSWSDDDSYASKWNMFLSEKVLSHVFISVLTSFINDVDMQAASAEDRETFLESYYQLLDFSSTSQTSVVKSISKGVTTLLETTDCKLLWSECAESWVSIDNAVLFVHDLAPSGANEVFLKLKLKLVIVPELIMRLIQGRVKKCGHFYDYERFISELLFPHIMSHKDIWKHHLLYILEETFPWAEKLLKSKPCIPCQQSTSLSHVRDVIDFQSSLAKLYDVDEGRFPIQFLLQSRQAKGTLVELGMSTSRLTSNQLRDRAESVEKLSLTPALERSHHLITYIHRFSSNILNTMSLLCNIRFLPVSQVPSEVKLPWFGTGCDFCSSSEAFPQSQSSLVFTVAKVTCPEADVLLSPKDPLAMIPQQLKNLMEFASKTSMDKATVSYLDTVMLGIYKYLADHDNISSVLDELQSILTPIWQDGIFLSPSKVFVNCDNVSCYPYVVKLSDRYSNLQRFFVTVLKVEKNLGPHVMIKILKEVYENFSATPLTDKVLAFVCQIALKLAQCKPEGEVVYLPDMTRVMRPVSQLACDNFGDHGSEWIKTLPTYEEHFGSGSGYFVHGNISRNAAIALGVKPLLEAIIQEFEDNSFLDGYDYGQCESLCVRLNSILAKYPADFSILQEFIQNADDACASEIVFVLDHRTDHPDKSLLCSNDTWRGLQHTPALCILNNRRFTEQDIVGISDLGRGAKGESSTKIGKFGIGFNVAYHVTDCPSFVSCGADGVPENLCVFDPTLSYVKRKGKQLPGRRWKLTTKHCSDFGDQFRPYLLAEVNDLLSDVSSGYAAFRLPLTRIKGANAHLPKGENFSVPDMQCMLEDFKLSSKEVLLFLNNVKSVSAFEINKDGKCAHCFTTTSVVPSLYESQCTQFLQQSVQVKGKVPTQCSLFHRLDIVQEVRNPSGIEKSSESWLIQKLVAGNFNSQQLETAMKHSLRAVGGIAGLVKAEKLKAPRLFCYLPTPVFTELPVHVNGHFTVDDSRKHLETQRVFGSNSPDWNHLLVQHVIGPAYVEFVVNAKQYYLDHHSSGLVDKCLYRFFPNVKPDVLSDFHFPSFASSSKKIDDLEIATTFYSNIDKNLPLFLIKAKENIWVSMKEVIFYLPSYQNGNKYIYVPQNIVSILLELNMKVVECPMHICEGFQKCKHWPRYLSQELVIDYLGMHIDVQKDDVKAVLVKEGNLEGLLDFCIQETRNKSVPSRVPMLLCADGSLQKIRQVYPHKYSQLLPKCLDRIVDEKLGSSSTGTRLANCKVIYPPDLQTIAKHVKLVDSKGPCVLEAEQLQLVSLLWKLKLHELNSTQEFDAFKMKPVIPTVGGKMYPVCLAKSVLGNPDNFLCQIMLDLGYSKIDMAQMHCEMSLIVEKLTFSKAEDLLSCFRLGKPPKHDHELSDEQVNWLVSSLSSYDKDELLSISPVLLNLKLFKHAADRCYISVGNARCITVPDQIPKSGLHLLRYDDTVFLKTPVAAKRFYENVIKNYPNTLIKPGRMYLQYVIPSFPSMSEELIIMYIDSIRNNPDLENSKPIIDLLKKTKLLLMCDGELVCAEDLYDPRVEMFVTFRECQLPSKKWRTSNERLNFLCKIGLCCQVSMNEWISQAEKLAAFETKDLIKKSGILFNQLLQIIKKSPQDHALDDFLTAVSEISFMCNSLSYKYFALARKLKLKIEFDPMVKFRHSISSPNASIGFCVRSVLPGKCDKLVSNSKFRKLLQVEHPVETKTVVENLICLCKSLNNISCFSDEGSSLKHAISIICQHYAHLNLVKLDTDVVSTLIEMACIVIYTDDALSKMVRPSQVVEQLPSDINLQPFCYRLSAEIAQYSSFTESLGIKKELSAADYQNLLNDIHKEGLSQDVQTQKVAECAYHELIRCLRQDQNSQQIMKNGFLLNAALQLVSSSELLYNDVPWYSTRTPPDMFQFILMPKPDAQGSKKPPRTLNVRSLSEAITEKVDEVCRSPDARCKDDLLYSQQKRQYACIVTEKILATLNSPEFVAGMYRIYYSDHHSNPPESFQEALKAFKKFEVICLDTKLTTVLFHNHKVIPSSEDCSQTCLLSREEGIIFVSPHGPNFDIQIMLKELSKQLNLALDHAIKNVQNIAILFESEPEHISAVLTKNQIQEYSFHEEHGTTSDVGTRLSLATLSPHEALIVLNFRQDEKVKYYSPSGELILARVVTPHVSMEGKRITNRCIEIATSDSSDDESFKVSPLEVFKILTLPQIKCLQSGKPNQFASPLNMAAIPCENAERITAWIKQLYASKDVLMYSGLLLSMVKIRLIAHLHFQLHTGKLSKELFKHATLEVVDCAADEPLPCCTSDDVTEKMIDTMCNSMEDLSLDLGEEEASSNSDADSTDANSTSSSISCSRVEIHSSDDDSRESPITNKQSRDSAPSKKQSCDRAPSKKQSCDRAPSKKNVTPQVFSTSKPVALQAVSQTLQQPVHEKHSKCDYSRYYSSGAEPQHSTLQPLSTPNPAPRTLTAPAALGTAYQRFSSKNRVNTTVPTRFKPAQLQEEKKEPPKPPIHKEKARAWLEQAKADFKAVQVLCEVDGEAGGGADSCQFPALVCFLSHDIVEKCLKGLLCVYVEKINQHTMISSNLVTVLQLLKSDGSRCSEKGLIKVLDDTVMVVSAYETKSRYPSLHNSFTAPAAVFVSSDAKEAFGAVSELMTSLIAVPLISEIIGDLGIVPKPKFISSMKSTTAESKYPDTWNEMTEGKDVMLFLVDPETEAEEYARVHDEFKLTLPHRKVLKIHRVQNKPLWDEYTKCSKNMERLNNGILKEELLFHGTRRNDPELIYGGRTGFDMRHSREGMWGRGNYFAKNASYSDGYAYVEGGIRKMFAAWVLTGQSYESAPNSRLTMPPVRQEGDVAEGKVQIRYDSVTGTSGGTRVYITYDNSHSYPAYLIVYQ